MSAPFKPGDRVRVKPSIADDYVQPWRNRLSVPRIGVVRFDAMNRAGRVLVEWETRGTLGGMGWQLLMWSRDVEHADTP